jgi:1-acyl-sn-glycerol-3-phosphate acyltransferase
MTTMTRLRRTLQVFTKMLYYLKLADGPGASYRDLKKRYTRELLAHLKIEVPQIPPAPALYGPAIFVCNHISYLDIPLIMNQIPEAAFVSKSEVASWPVLGLAAKRIGTVFVKREKKSSRASVRRSLVEALQLPDKKIVVFPSGTTTIHKTPYWRKGVFEIAQDLGVPVIPVRLHYTPLREAAYIDDDNFVLHLLKLAGGPGLHASLEFGAPVYVQNPVADCARIQQWCEEAMTQPILQTAPGFVLSPS